VDSPKIQEYLGVDVGGTRVGFARGNSTARIAQPLKVADATEAIKELGNLAQLHSSDGIVVGLPRGLNGDETAQTKIVRQWVNNAQTQINLPFFWQDEALTSQEAESLKLKAKSPGIDAQAAAIILQDFLDTPEDDRVAV